MHPLYVSPPREEQTSGEEWHYPLLIAKRSINGHGSESTVIRALRSYPCPGPGLLPVLIHASNNNPQQYQPLPCSRLSNAIINHLPSTLPLSLLLLFIALHQATMAARLRLQNKVAIVTGAAS